MTLLGRTAEVRELQRLIDSAAFRRSSAALILHGEAGVGKTTLLEHVADGVGRSFLHLRASPLQAEAELPFAGLFDLVRPVQHLLERLPEVQRAALGGALALGPPAPGDRFGVAAGVLSLLAAAADESPVLAIVDDAHWLDAPSREGLLFAARRLAHEGVVLVLAMRHRDWIARAGVASRELRGLPASAAAELVDNSAAGVDPGVRRRLIDETCGNPLAILQALKTLSDAQLRGTAPITRPLAVGLALQETFAEHLAGLPPATRRALLVAAASDTGSLGEIIGALTHDGLTRAALEPAERDRVVSVTVEGVAFRHPLIRSAAYHLHDPVDRRAAHGALAAASRGDRAAWHLALASDGPDESVAATLEAMGERSLSRSAYATAAGAFQTAAALSAEDGGRLRRALSAGRALWLGGDGERAAAVLDSVRELATEPVQRAELEQIRAAAMLWVRPVTESYDVLIREAQRVAPHDAERAAAMFASASLACVMRSDFARGVESARRAAAAYGDAGVATIVGPVMLGVSAAIGGDVHGARAELEPLIERLEAIEPRNELFSVRGAVAWTLAWIEQWALAESLADRLVQAAREAGAPSALPMPLTVAAHIALRRGKTAAAYAAAAEAVQLAAQTGQSVASAFSLLTLARAEAVLGYEQDCRAHVAAARDFARHTQAQGIASYCDGVLALLELTCGRPERVADHLAVLLDPTEGVTLEHLVQTASDLAEASVRTGARDVAERSTAVLEAKAQDTGLRWPRAVAARCRGLLAEDDFETPFGEALALFGTELPFETARTQLNLGMRRRRAKQRKRARAPLREALRYFQTSGAEPWAQMARNELRAAGETSLSGGEGSLRSLTPQELQVALTVARGATNRETAAALFLSEKTVELHLTNAYRKLGLRSRAELALRVAENLGNPRIARTAPSA